MENIPALKKALRKNFSSLRKGLDSREAKRKSELAQAHILASHEWRHARAVALYAALPGEVETDLLLNAAWKSGKLLFLPKVLDAEKRLMRFFPCSGRSDLKKGAFGILEPPVSDSGTLFQPDFMLVPGLAFDRRGYRLGYGGGFYDTFLAAFIPAFPLAGFAFFLQIVNELPHDPWDVRMNAVCSEEELEWL